MLSRAAVGLVPIASGSVRLLGSTVQGLRERELLALRRRSPYVVQGPALLDWRTLGENVALAAKAPDDAADALRRFGLESFADRLPHEVGPGLQKRAALARAFVLRPEYLLLDEPTTGLDREATAQVTDALISLREQGVSALVVSHDYRAVSSLADRVWVVAKGRCAFSGTPAAFLESMLPEVRALTAPGLSE